MNRRDFLKTSMAGSAAGLAISATAAAGATTETFSRLTEFEWNEATIQQLSSAMVAGRISAALPNAQTHQP